MHTTSISLLERLRFPADQAAWERFVKLYTPLLCHWVRRSGVRGQDVADVVQDVFTVLVRKLPAFRYDPHRRFRAWLWTVTRNKCRERLRRAAARPGEAAFSQCARPDEVSVFDEGEYRHYVMKRALQLMQADFQPSTWKAFWACVVEERPTPDVAVELGLSTDAVYAAKSRVLRRLRQELDSLLD
ncbi:MAG TPA: sigma-70 family RNA polymerase sigma factor [Gemmataceae bacterium]|jgi:RNA polymerase sigma-70 factor (ECF subfamily)|nr:sigma-70 family RNA polymerase sigma factor [Gemmataceae bacterium]